MGAMARDSMWKLLWRYGITPLLPDSIRSRLVDATVSVPHWIDRRFARRWEVGKQIPAALPRIEGCYSHQTAGALRGLSSVADSLELPVSRFTVEKRYPFLDRRLVEFALSLPANMIFRLGTSKWILRKAVAESVPEIIRDRRSKGWIDGRLCRTLAQHPSFVAELIRDPLVAQAGWVDPVALRREVSRAAAGAVSGTLALMRTLSLESWLRAREGSPLCANG